MLDSSMQLTRDRNKSGVQFTLVFSPPSALFDCCLLALVFGWDFSEGKRCSAQADEGGSFGWDFSRGMCSAQAGEGDDCLF